MAEQALKHLGNPKWVKGCPSPNPKGRPRTGLSLAEAVRRQTDPDEVAQLAIDIIRGKAIRVTRDGVPTGEWIVPRMSDVTKVLDWLRDTGYIKPPTTIAIGVDDSKSRLDFSLLTEEQLDAYVGLLAVAAGEKLLGD